MKENRLTPQGFTLIELIISIVIIAIIAITAAPKFTNLSGKSHDNVAANLAGTLEEGIRLMHIQWQLSPHKDRQLNVVGNIDFNTAGYPVGKNKKRSAPIRLDTNNDCQVIFRNAVTQTSFNFALIDNFQDIKRAGKVPKDTDIAIVVFENNSRPGHPYFRRNCVYAMVRESKTSGDEISTIIYKSHTGKVITSKITIP